MRRVPSGKDTRTAKVFPLVRRKLWLRFQTQSLGIEANWVTVRVCWHTCDGLARFQFLQNPDRYSALSRRLRRNQLRFTFALDLLGHAQHGTACCRGVRGALTCCVRRSLMTDLCP